MQAAIIRAPEISLGEAWFVLDGTRVNATVDASGHMTAPGRAIADGVHSITAYVNSSVGVCMQTWTFMSIVDAVHSVPGRFNITLPQSWVVGIDQAFGGSQVAMMASGPVLDGNLMYLLVQETTGVPVRQGRAGIQEIVDEYIAQMKVNGVDITADGAVYGTYAGQNGALLSFRWESIGFIQHTAIIASSEHRAFWVISLFSTSQDDHMFSPVFETAVQSMEITMAPASAPLIEPGPMMLLILVAVVAVVAVLVVVLVKKRKKA